MRFAFVILSSLFAFFPIDAGGQAPMSPAMVQKWANTMFYDGINVDLLPEFEDSYGVVFRDLNNDNLADIYIVRFRNLNRLFINRGPDKPFEDFTIKSGLGGNLMASKKRNLELGASAADCDNNGWPDVLITGWRISTLFFNHRRGAEYEPLDLNKLFQGPVDANAGVWADINTDGNLDLFLTDEYFYNRLLINQGFGNLKSAEDIYNLDLPPGNSQGAAFGDVDGDGFPDLYVCNWFGPDVFYRNIGGKVFKPVELSLPHLIDSLNSNGVSFGDIDNDGDLDLLVTDRNKKTCLYRNDTPPGDKRWQFTDITVESGIQNHYPAYGSIIADFNNDGFQDIFFTNIGPNQFYVNEGLGRFRLIFEEKAEIGPAIKNYSTGAAVADFDNDGDLDLFVANKDTISILYRNPLNNQNFIRFHLEGIKSNADAIGAKIWLYRERKGDTAILQAYREISGGGGYLSFSEPIVHFGVNPAFTYKAKFLFPSGEEIVLQNL
ncbi:MAG: CRTAC1 family protein, partial [Calditrichia bacterium]